MKQSPEKRVLHVSLEEVDGMIRVRFQDHGIGIAAKHLPFIFERFYRAAPSNGGDSHSGGLGVAIAPAIPRAPRRPVRNPTGGGAGPQFFIFPAPVSLCKN